MPPSPRKRSPVRKQQLAALERGYQVIAPEATRFAHEVVRQFDEILRQGNLPLAVPIEYRVKTWVSIAEKIERKRLQLETIQDVTDLIGVRAILLFRRDVESGCKLIGETFKVLSREDTVERLSESQFGYSSIHFTVEVPPEWLKLPTVQRFRGLKAELQVRTVAQHLWAASSHILQYKHETSVPPPMRRAIYRVSALLETIDLEFERLLTDRDLYAGSIDVRSEAEILNVDSLLKVLDTIWPPQNRIGAEDLSDLLEDVLAMNVKSPEQLTQILKKQRAATLKIDARDAKNSAHSEASPSERNKSGIYYTWTGLTRTALSLEFGKTWTNYSFARVMPISVLGLPAPIARVLKSAQITLVCELATATEGRLTRLPRFDPKYLPSVVDALRQFELRLGMAETDAARIFARHPDVEELWDKA